METTQDTLSQTEFNNLQTKYKDEILKLTERKKTPPKQINNSDLHAGAPMYYYCRACGHQSDCLPEEHFGSPLKFCSPCQHLLDVGMIKKDGSLRLHPRKMTKCGECHGTGTVRKSAKKGGLKDCRECDGTGQVEYE